VSGFCVFGVTRQDCVKRARAKVSTRDPATKAALSPEEWTAKVGAEADRLFEIARPKQISPAFDSPQFCADWIALGLRGAPPQIRAPRVMAKGKKIDAKGKELTRKGVPVIGWVPYSQPSEQPRMRTA
jgi:hypothetical protein